MLMHVRCVCRWNFASNSAERVSFFGRTWSEGERQAPRSSPHQPRQASSFCALLCLLIAMRWVPRKAPWRASRVVRPPDASLRKLSNAWLTAPPSHDTPRTALLLLNTPPRPASALRTLWALSSYRVCADAAANRLRDSIQLAMGDEGAMVSGNPAALRERLVRLRHVAKMHESMVPDAVTGDFDSIKEEVLEFYEKRKRADVKDPKCPSSSLPSTLHAPFLLIAFTLLASRRRLQDFP